MRENRVPATQVQEWPGAGKTENGLKSLGELLVSLAAKDLKPERAIELAIRYYEPMLKEKFDDFPRRQKDLEQLLPMASRYQKLRSFLDDLALEPPSSVADMSPDTRGECLTLSTVHSAKGLEWSVVLIIWATEGYFPSMKGSQSEDGLEEERRLMYVAATRAKDHLILCYPGQEIGYGWSSGYNASSRGLSSFIQALPHGLFEFRSMGTAERVWSPSIAASAPQKVQEPPPEFPAGLRAGDRVRHPAFGHGVISKRVDKEKVEVLFRDYGRKLLHLGYTSLERI
jgi:DNA helicase-2/ATP-dependent DNA helicase PcrA